MQLPIEYVFIILLMLALGSLSIYTLLLVNKLENRDLEYKEVNDKLQKYNELLVQQTRKSLEANVSLKKLLVQDPLVEPFVAEKEDPQNGGGQV